MKHGRGGAKKYSKMLTFLKAKIVNLEIIFEALFS